MLGSSAMPAVIVLSATCRFITGSRARYTTPMAPCPNSPRTSYLPSFFSTHRHSTQENGERTYRPGQQRANGTILPNCLRPAYCRTATMCQDFGAGETPAYRDGNTSLKVRTVLLQRTPCPSR